MGADAGQRAPRRAAAGPVARDAGAKALSGAARLLAQSAGPDRQAAGLLEGVPAEEGLSGEAGFLEETGCCSSESEYCGFELTFELFRTP